MDVGCEYEINHQSEILKIAFTIVIYFSRITSQIFTVRNYLPWTSAIVIYTLTDTFIYNECGFIVGPTPQTVGQQYTNIGPSCLLGFRRAELAY